MKQSLSIEILCSEAAIFANAESTRHEPKLFGVTDGKAVGTYLEHKFRDYLTAKYRFGLGSSASGIDFPELEVDMKVTSIRHPQSSCPYESARQKIYGLGYGILMFVYEKTDDNNSRTGRLDIHSVIFIEKDRTADYQMTRGIAEILQRDGNADDLIAFFADRNLPVDDIGANNIANELLKRPLSQGYLTISNALQWRLQYGRVINQAGNVPGLIKIR